MLLAYKEQGRRRMVSHLSPLMVAAIRAAANSLVSPDAHMVLVPIPTTAAARRRRNGDHLRPLVAAARRADRGLFRI
ncbi:MAG: hypothetical protein ACRDTD_25630, partial [Pseudonocardiaceae bacterium]